MNLEFISHSGARALERVKEFRGSMFGTTHIKRLFEIITNIGGFQVVSEGWPIYGPAGGSSRPIRPAAKKKGGAAATARRHQEVFAPRRDRRRCRRALLFRGI